MKGKPMARRMLGAWAAALAASAAAAAAALQAGPYPAGLQDLWGSGPGHRILLDVRLPRVLTAEVAGAVLAAAGVAFQALLRNPLAEPYTLGVASGASLGAVSAILLGWDVQVAGLGPVSLMALAGALGAMLAVYGTGRVLARRAGADASYGLLLAGICLAVTFQSLILLFHYLADFGNSFRMLRWLMGGLGMVGFDGFFRVLPFAMTGLAILFVLAGDLNYLVLGEELARARGVPVLSVQRAAYFGASLATAGIVASVGPIGFVGLVVPHVARVLVGPDIRVLLPTSAGLGALFLLACDTVARTVFAPTEIPTGVLTSLVGGPAAVLILLGRARKSTV